MMDLDRYLLTPHQREALRAEGESERHILRTALILGLAFCAQLALTVLIAVILGLYIGFTGGDAATLAAMPSWSTVLISLFTTAGAVGLILLFHIKAPGRVGCKGPFAAEYLAGLVAGFAAFSAAVVICVLTGALTVEGISPGFSPIPWLLILMGFLIQGLSEELMCRGLLMLSITRLGLVRGWKNPALLAVLLNSLLFAALHLGNDGIAPLALLNLFLFGVFASLYYLWRGNIWGIAAFHSIWNFTQGNVFGILVSGGDFGTSLLTSTVPDPVTTSSPLPVLINGGSFGLEGGLAVTVVLAAGIALVCWRNARRIANAPVSPGLEF